MFQLTQVKNFCHPVNDLATLGMHQPTIYYLSWLNSEIFLKFQQDKFCSDRPNSSANHKIYYFLKSLPHKDDL